MNMPDFISQPIDNLLLKLYRRRGGPDNPFKQNDTNENVKIKAEDELYDWFLRSVNSVGGLEWVFHDDKIVIFPYVSIKNDFIVNMSFQVLATINCSILDYRDRKDKCSAAYFRLDYHPKEIGKIFSHPMPHIHISNKYDARIPFAIASPMTCILDFIEFLYINFDYEKWLSWAKKVWRKSLTCSLADPYKNEDCFDIIQEGFEQGRIMDDVFMDKYGESIRKFRQKLFNEKKEKAAKLFRIPTNCTLINYLGWSDKIQ